MHFTDYLNIGCNPFFLKGKKEENIVELYPINLEDEYTFLKGTPLGIIDELFFKKSSKIFNSIKNYYNKREHNRISRIIYAFKYAITRKEYSNRLHHFVRCIEGFIYPEEGKTKNQFKSRTELFIGPRHHDFMGKMYRIRSAIVHLHNFFDIINETGDFKEREYILIEYAIAAEAIARYCISTFFINKNLWPYFDNEKKPEKFWKKFNQNKKEIGDIWGKPMNFDEELKRIRNSINILKDSY
jgi:hypothetical protein